MDVRDEPTTCRTFLYDGYIATLLVAMCPSYRRGRGRGKGFLYNNHIASPHLHRGKGPHQSIRGSHLSPITIELITVGVVS